MNVLAAQAASLRHHLSGFGPAGPILLYFCFSAPGLLPGLAMMESDGGLAYYMSTMGLGGPLQGQAGFPPGYSAFGLDRQFFGFLGHGSVTNQRLSIYSYDL